MPFRSLELGTSVLPRFPSQDSEKWGLGHDDVVDTCKAHTTEIMSNFCERPDDNLTNFSLENHQAEMAAHLPACGSHGE